MPTPGTVNSPRFQLVTERVLCARHGPSTNRVSVSGSAAAFYPPFFSGVGATCGVRNCATFQSGSFSPRIIRLPSTTIRRNANTSRSWIARYSRSCLSTVRTMLVLPFAQHLQSTTGSAMFILGRRLLAADGYCADFTIHLGGKNLRHFADHLIGLAEKAAQVFECFHFARHKQIRHLF